MWVIRVLGTVGSQIRAESGREGGRAVGIYPLFQ